MLPTQLRVSLKCIALQRRRHWSAQTYYRKHYHPSPPRQAVENPDSIISQLQSSPLLQRLGDKPEALKALHDFAQLLKESDIEFSANRPPSTMQIFRLATNPQFRESAKNVVNELRKAGIDITSENAFELLTGMKTPKR